MKSRVYCIILVACFSVHSVLDFAVTGLDVVYSNRFIILKQTHSLTSSTIKLNNRNQHYKSKEYNTNKLISLKGKIYSLNKKLL